MRVAIRIGLLLLLGFVINAVITARAVTWSSDTLREEKVEAEDARGLLQSKFRGVEIEPDVAGSVRFGTMITWTVVMAEGYADGKGWGFHLVWQTDVGWPLRSFRGVQHHWGVMMKEQASVAGMIVLPDRIFGMPMPGLVTGRGRLIPVRPMWGGLAANTLLYALAAGAVGWMGRQVRRRARLDRRCCAECRYDLRASLEGEPVRCPECAAVYTISVFRRPRQVLRCWMIVYCAPLLVIGGMWLFSDSLGNAGQTLRIKLNEPANYFGWPTVLNTIVLTALIAASAYSLASRSYKDRPRSVRMALATSASLVLTALCLPAALLLIHGLSP